MVKLLLKFFSQERITVKKGDDAKEQHLKLVNDVAINEAERFLNFNKLTDRLDTFYANLLPFHDFAAVWKVLKIIFCMFHGQLAVEHGFNTNAKLAI